MNDESIQTKEKVIQLEKIERILRNSDLKCQMNERVRKQQFLFRRDSVRKKNRNSTGKAEGDKK